MASTSAAHRGTAACLQAFAQVLQLTSAAPDPFKDQLNLSDLSDELGRLRVWAANIGALQKGHSSLDYRLREAPLVHENIVKLLNELCSSLREMSLILSGIRLPYDLEPKPKFGDHSSDSSSSCSSTSEKSVASDDSFGGTPSELQQRFTSVMDIINNLYKLSRTIRIPSIQSRVLKAASFKKIDKETGVDLISQFGAFDLAYTTEMFHQFRREANLEDRDANVYKDGYRNWCNEDDLFAKRLSSAITQRRQQFMYWKRHREKLGIEVVDENFCLVILPTPQERSTIDTALGRNAHPPLPLIDSKQESQNNTKTEENSIAGRTALTKTTATVFLSTDNTSDNGQSTTSFATTARGLDGKKVEFPSLPMSVKSMRDFECPYCFTICPTKYQSPRAWRAHLLRDLRPYVCTYLKCDSSNQLFGSRFDWLEHERAHHRRAWLCPEHIKERFRTEGEFEQHLRMTEHHTLSKMPVSESIAISVTSDPDPRRVCAICRQSFTSAEDLHKHLANHLERLAAFAFPRDKESGDDRLSEDGSGIKSLRADARSIEPEDLGGFKIYSSQDLLLELETARDLLKELMVTPKNHFTVNTELEALGTKFDNLEKFLHAGGLSPFIEDVTGLILRLQNTFSGFLIFENESDGTNKKELDEQLQIQNEELTRTLMKDSTSYIKTLEKGLPPTDPFLIVGPRDEDLAIQDKTAKDAFINIMTGPNSPDDFFDAELSWYVGFVESKMRVTWTHFFEPTLSGLSHKSLEPQQGDWAVAYRYLERVAFILQQPVVLISLKDIVHDPYIHNLWNLRHPKAFWHLAFCAVGWLTLLYEPSHHPDPETFLLAGAPKAMSGTMWSQLSIPIAEILSSQSNDGLSKEGVYYRLPTTIEPEELCRMIWRTELKPVFTNSIFSHLKVDEANMTVSLFRYPAFCAILFRATNKNHARAVNGLHSEMMRGLSRLPTDYVGDICRDIPLSYLSLQDYWNKEYNASSISFKNLITSAAYPLWRSDIRNGEDPFLKLVLQESPANDSTTPHPMIRYVGIRSHFLRKLPYSARNATANLVLCADFEDACESLLPLFSRPGSSANSSQKSLSARSELKTTTDTERRVPASADETSTDTGLLPHLPKTYESGLFDSTTSPDAVHAPDLSRVPSSGGSSGRSSPRSFISGGSDDGATSSWSRPNAQAKKKRQKQKQDGILKRGQEFVSNIFAGRSARQVEEGTNIQPP